MNNHLRVALSAILILVATGCGQSPAPLAGGRPVRHWVKALEDPDARVRRQAIARLGNAGPADPAIVPALTAALRDRDAEVRCAAIVALVKLGPAAHESAPVLGELQRADRSARVRTYAAQALAKMQEGS